MLRNARETDIIPPQNITVHDIPFLWQKGHGLIAYHDDYIMHVYLLLRRLAKRKFNSVCKDATAMLMLL